MIHLTKHYKHLKHDNQILLKDTVRESGTKRSMAATNMTDTVIIDKCAKS